MFGIAKCTSSPVRLREEWVWARAGHHRCNGPSFGLGSATRLVSSFVCGWGWSGVLGRCRCPGFEGSVVDFARGTMVDMVHPFRASVVARISPLRAHCTQPPARATGRGATGTSGRHVICAIISPAPRMAPAPGVSHPPFAYYGRGRKRGVGRKVLPRGWRREGRLSLEGWVFFRHWGVFFVTEPSSPAFVWARSRTPPRSHNPCGYHGVVFMGDV